MVTLALFLKFSQALLVHEDDFFPTAQLVAAMRLIDARSPKPLIGSNVNAGPDLAAETLAGKLGVAFLSEFSKETKISPKIASTFLGLRSMFLDEKLLQAASSGCRQFVILAAGLDIRAWRLPQLNETHTMFEVDRAPAIAYKQGKLPDIEALYPLATCNRVEVEADLRESSWTQKLKRRGFRADEPSFFLVEGLLMYLPPDAPVQLFRSISNLMSPGSTLSGDSFVGYGYTSKKRKSPSVLEKYGARWTWDAKSRDELRDILSKTLLEPEMIVGVPELLYTYQSILHGNKGKPTKPRPNPSGRAEYACFAATKHLHKEL